MKKLFFFNFCFAISLIAQSQIQIVNPPELVCPGVAISFSAFAASTEGSCSSTYRWTVTNGVFLNGQTTMQGLYSTMQNVSVIWDNIPFQGGISIPKGTLKFEVFNCPLPSGKGSLPKLKL